jgi:gas vesicle protein
MKKSNVVFGILAGAAVGALLGVLFAPDKGSKTRRKLYRKGEDMVDDLKDKAHDLAEKANELSRKASKLVDKVNEKVQTVKHEAETAAGNARSKFTEMKDKMS